MSSLAEALRKNFDAINDYLYVGFAQWDDLMRRIERQEPSDTHGFGDEQMWTFIVGAAYAMAGEEGVARLTGLLTGSSQREAARPRIWFEVLPIPPRKREGETHLDLALGTIARREGTKSGIEFEAVDSSWICFCEMKWHSDISTYVTYDAHRNQLARVIENALCFQGGDKYGDNVHVTLVTPRIFRDAAPKSRLYQYKFDEYATDASRLIEDLEACRLEPRDQADWSYPPDLAERTEHLSLHWATYDELFDDLPDSPLAGPVRDFWTRYGNYGRRGPGG